MSSSSLSLSPSSTASGASTPTRTPHSPPPPQFPLEALQLMRLQQLQEELHRIRTSQANAAQPEEQEELQPPKTTTTTTTTKPAFRDLAHLRPPTSGYQAPTSIAHMTFGEKLHTILQDVSLASIVEWRPHGRAFKIYVPQLFALHVCPQYFGHAKLEQFYAELKAHGFKEVKSGLDQHSFYHERFLRYRMFLSKTILRQEQQPATQQQQQSKQAIHRHHRSHHHQHHKAQHYHHHKNSSNTTLPRYLPTQLCAFSSAPPPLTQTITPSASAASLKSAASVSKRLAATPSPTSMATTATTPDLMTQMLLFQQAVQGNNTPPTAGVVVGP